MRPWIVNISYSNLSYESKQFWNAYIASNGHYTLCIVNTIFIAGKKHNKYRPFNGCAIVGAAVCTIITFPLRKSWIKRWFNGGVRTICISFAISSLFYIFYMYFVGCLLFSRFHGAISVNVVPVWLPAWPHICVLCIIKLVNICLSSKYYTLFIVEHSICVHVLLLLSAAFKRQWLGGCDAYCILHPLNSIFNTY